MPIIARKISARIFKKPAPINAKTLSRQYKTSNMINIEIRVHIYTAPLNNRINTYYEEKICMLNKLN